MTRCAESGPPHQRAKVFGTITPTGIADSGLLIGEPRPVKLSRRFWFFLTVSAVTVLAIALRFTLPIYRQQRAIAEIKRLNGWVDTEPSAPQWLTNRIGNQWTSSYVRVTEVGFSEGTTDDDTVWLSAFPEAQSLCLNSSRLGDATLLRVGGMTSLKRLRLDETQITDAGLMDLQSLDRLIYLSLSGTQVTDAGLECVRNLPCLLALNVAGTDVTDRGLEHLSGARSLVMLSLDGTPITDAGMVQISQLSSLSRLFLRDTGVTDAGLEHLKSLTNLSKLRIRGTLVTKTGCERLRKALPRLAIDDPDS